MKDMTVIMITDGEIHHGGLEEGRTAAPTPGGETTTVGSSTLTITAERRAVEGEALR